MSEAGQRLREARKSARISAEELARRVGSSASAVRNQENGTNGIPAPKAAEYAEVLGVSANWILFGDGVGPSVSAPRAPVTMSTLPGGKARLEMNVTLPFATALQILSLVEEASKS